MPNAATWKAKSPIVKRLIETMRMMHMSRRTEAAYVHWCCDLFAWSGCQSAECLSGELVEQFLTHIAVERKVSASTQNQCFNACLFLFRHVLKKELGNVDAKRAKVSKHLPEWLTVQELKLLLRELDGEWLLLTRLGYGTGLRLMELLRLRVKDIQAGNGIIFVRDGKGGKDRMVTLPKSIEVDMCCQIAKVSAQHTHDLKNGFGKVWLPHALAKKYPNAPKQVGWQWLFPSRQICKADDGEMRRHHLFPNGFQSALRQAGVKAGLTKRVHPHVLRHTFATHFLENGGNLQTLQALLGHKEITTTMIYTHCVDLKKAKSPLDSLE